MNNFKYMDKTVDDICNSLINEPEQWKFGVFRFNKNGSNIDYSVDLNSVTKVWEGGDVHTVFSYEQGEKIVRAYRIAREKQASTLQKNIIESTSTTNTSNMNNVLCGLSFVLSFVLLFVLFFFIG